MILTVSNDAEGPIVDPRPLVFLKSEDGRLRRVSYGLCGSEDGAEHRIVGGHNQQLSFFFPDNPELTESAPLVYGLEFTDMTGLGWWRIGGSQPVRLVGAEAEVEPLAVDPDHGHRERRALRCLDAGGRQLATRRQRPHVRGRAWT